MTFEEKNQSRRSTRVGVLALVIVALILGSGLVYFAQAETTQARSNSSTISSLQSSVSSLRAVDQALQSQLSSATNTVTNETSPSSGGNTSVTNAINAEEIFAAASPSVVTVQGTELLNSTGLFGTSSALENVLGSGFVISDLGSYYIVTNFHVVGGVRNMTVTFSDGDAYPATAIGTDPYSDLAVVSVKGAPVSEYHPLQIVSSDNVVVGEPTVAIGNPYGLSGSITYGIVSQLGRTIQEATTNGFSISDVIQFSAPINPGNSGGPLLNEEGDVIGITTASVNGSQGLGFAIPSSTILRELPSLISTGSYNEHAYLGIGTADMNYQLAQASSTNVTYGVLVETIVNGGPAAKAGIKAGSTSVVVNGIQYVIGGDIVVSINGTKIANGDALSTYLEEHTVAGQTIQLDVIRAGQQMTVSLVLGTRPGL